MGEKNELGEEILSNEEIQTMEDGQLASCIAEFNMWRRAEGRYGWYEEPEKNKPCPYDPSSIGRLLDEAAQRLSASAE